MFGVIEGTGFEIIDAEFEQCIIGHAKVERLSTGCRWVEGPAYFPAGRYITWSDIPNNRIMRWDETDGTTSIFREPSNNSNGHTVDNQGRLVSCEHLSRRVTRTGFDGKIEIIADNFNGKRLNSPNDVVVKSDDSIWFSDPSYGIMMDYEGERADSEIGACNVYRWDANTKEITAIKPTFDKPNGLAFSTDEKLLYVSDTGGTHTENGPAHIRCFTLTEDGKDVAGEIGNADKPFANCTAGFFDGFRLDTHGRIWTSAADGVHCLNTDGKLIGKIQIPEFVSNVCFGGIKKNRLFITATTSLYAVYLNVNGY